MKKNIVYTLLGVVLILVNLSINYDASSNDDTLGVFSKFEMSFTQAKAWGGSTIKCKCALFGGNNKCLASNSGSKCYQAEDADCQIKNRNCGGTNPDLEDAPGSGPSPNMGD